MGAVAVAWHTGPRRAARAPIDFTEPRALKALRPFGLEDAAIFVHLQREQNLRECLDAITDPRLSFWYPLWGLGLWQNLSYFKPGLWPALLKQKTPHQDQTYQCVYVKFTDLDPPRDPTPRRLLRSSNCRKTQAATADVLTLLESVALPGSPPLVLLFDQFEQFFIHHKRKKDREAFVHVVALVSSKAAYLSKFWSAFVAIFWTA